MWGGCDRQQLFRVMCVPAAPPGMIFFLPSPWNRAAPLLLPLSFLTAVIPLLFLTFIILSVCFLGFFFSRRLSLIPLASNGCSRTPNSKKEAIISKYKWLNQLEEVQKQLHRFVDSLARKPEVYVQTQLFQETVRSMCFRSFCFSSWS